MRTILDRIEISNTTLDDIEGIVHIENLSFSIPWSENAFKDEIIKNDLAFYITAKINTKIVGYIGMWKIFEEGHITNIAIHPDHRNQGIGVKLLKEILDICKTNKIKRITLEVRKSNYIAQKLYIKQGFEINGIRKKYYSDNNEDAFIMWKEILDDNI